jgi:hypothetical protein
MNESMKVETAQLAPTFKEQFEKLVDRVVSLEQRMSAAEARLEALIARRAE